MVATAFSPDGPDAFAVTVTVSPIFTVPDETDTDTDPDAARAVSAGPNKHRHIHKIIKNAPNLFFIFPSFLRRLKKTERHKFMLIVTVRFEKYLKYAFAK